MNKLICGVVFVLSLVFGGIAEGQHHGHGHVYHGHTGVYHGNYVHHNYFNNYSHYYRPPQVYVSPYYYAPRNYYIPYQPVIYVWSNGVLIRVY